MRAGSATSCASGPWRTATSSITVLVVAGDAVLAGHLRRQRGRLHGAGADGDVADAADRFAAGPAAVAGAADGGAVRRRHSRPGGAHQEDAEDRGVAHGVWLAWRLSRWRRTTAGRARSRRAIARATSSRKPPASKVSIAACVVPPGEVTRRRSSSAGSSGFGAACAPRRAAVCSTSARAASAGRPCGLAGGLHRFGQQEHVGRAAAGHRGDRVHPRFVVDPDRRPDRVEQRVGARRAARRRRCALANRPVTPAPSSAGVFGIARTTAQAAAEPALELRGGDAGGDRDHQRPLRLRQRRQAVADLAHHLRLDREHPDAGAVGGRGGVVGEHAHAEVARQRLAQRRRPVRRRGSRRRACRARPGRRSGCAPCCRRR